MANKSKTYDRTVYSTWQWIRIQSTINGFVVTNSGAPTTNTSARAFKRDYKSRSWTTQLGWKAFRASNGYLPTMTLTETQYQWTQQGPMVAFIFGAWPAVGSEMRFQYGATLYCPTSQPNALSSGERDKLMLDAKYQALGKARDMKVNLPVLFGEGRQTVRMIADTARTLGKAYRNFRRGRFRQAARDLGIDKPSGALSNHWLAYSYGWMPLISDAKGLAELAAQQLELGGRPPRFSVRGRAFIPERELNSTAVGQGYHAIGGNTTWMGSSTYQGRAGLLCEVQFTQAALAAQVGGGIYDPLLLAWELTPFSFVFDWFIGVGEWLESASSLQGLTVKAGFASTTEVTKGTSYVSSIPAGWSVDGPQPRTDFTVRNYRRLNWLGDVSSIKTPLWDALNARRITTTAALWRQRTRGDRIFGKYRP